MHNPNIASEKKMTVDAFVKNNTNYGVEICKGRVSEHREMKLSLELVFFFFASVTIFKS